MKKYLLVLVFLLPSFANAATTKFIEPGTDATQDFSFYQGTSLTTGTIAATRTAALDGPRSIGAQTTSAGGNASAYTPDATISDAGALMSAWFRFSTNAPSTITGFMFAEQATDGSMVIGVGMNTNGTLHFGGRGATAKDGTTVLQANTWYRISIGYIITSSTVWTAKLYINGKLELTTGNADGTLSLVTTSDAAFGIVNSSQLSFNNPAAMTVWVDSVYIDNRTDQTDCGNVHVTEKRPFANGTTNGFTTQIGAGGSSYGTGHSPQVNEQPLNVANGWSIVTVATPITEEYNIEGNNRGDLNISTATLVDYMGWIYYKTVLSETASIIVNNVSTAFTSTVNTNTMKTQAAGSTTYPPGTGTDVGMVTSNTATTVSLFEAGIVFAYIPQAYQLWAGSLF